MDKIKILKNFIKKPIVFYVFTFFMFSPLLFLNIRNDHDWGGDFAQYLSQAENLYHFKTMDSTGYIYNESYSSLAPKAYPPVFPIIISPITFLFKNQTTPYNYLITIILILCALLTVLLLNKKIGKIPAILLSMVIFYNPYFITLKSEIIADIPFAFFVLCFVLLTYNPNKNTTIKWIFAGLFAGLAASTKSIGNILFASIFIYAIQVLIIEWKKSKNIKTIFHSIKPWLYMNLIGISLTFILNLAFFHRLFISSGYSNTFKISELSYKIVGDNLFYYSEILRTFFLDLNSTELWLSSIFGSVVLSFFIIGVIISFNKRPELKEWIILVYFSILIIYPYQHSGFRFFVPIASLIIYYTIITLLQLRPGKGGIVSIIVVFLFIFLLYKPQIIKIQRSVQIIQEGPYLPNVISAFEKIKQNTNPNDIVVFNKPSVLSRYIQRRSLSHKPGSTMVEMEEQYKKLKPNYFLIYNGLPDVSLENYINTKPLEISLIWCDDTFKLYKKL